MTESLKYLFLAGILLVFFANTFMREKDGPSKKLGQIQRPWHKRDGLTDAGHIVRLSGLALLLILAGTAVIIRFT